MVARDGIEPPTPAFSGLRSTPELPGHILTYAGSVGSPGGKSFNFFNSMTGLTYAKKVLNQMHYSNNPKTTIWNSNPLIWGRPIRSVTNLAAIVKCIPRELPPRDVAWQSLRLQAPSYA